MLDHNYLRDSLFRLDGRSYNAYKDLRGTYQYPEFNLIIEYVQGDPFATPSKLRLKISQSVAGFPNSLYYSKIRAVALSDYLTREFGHRAKNYSGNRGSGKSGLISIVSCSQEVLERSAISIDDQEVEVRFVVGLPARGRTILGREAEKMLFEDLPMLVQESLKYASLNADILRKHLEVIEDSEWLRQQLPSQNLIAFVANDSLLPRSSGVDFTPLAKEAIPFQSPPSLEVEFNCPNSGLIKGMGIPAGITLIVGGGYHGKSTLLKALEVGIYNHIPGDGREFVVTNPLAVKIRSEEGRSIGGVDISPFINSLPLGRSTSNFATTNASGSTSCAANIMEALEAGAQVLLIDEDTTATNFMIRDRRMQQLIEKEKEPITPFVDKVQQLYREYGVSTVIVMGGSGDYFEVADLVIAMDNFLPQDVTAKAKIIASDYQTQRLAEGGQKFGAVTKRIPLPESIDPSRGRASVKLKVQDRDEVSFGREDIDLAGVDQIVEVGQLKAIAYGIVYAKDKYMDGLRTFAEILTQVMGDIESQGLDILTEFPQGDLALFRASELACALNRLRTLKIKSQARGKTF